MPGHDPAPDVAIECLLVRLTINGVEHARTVAPWISLLDLLREDLHLTGSKKGCDHGQCCPCAVLIDGQRINACLQLAVMRDGARITKIEGLAAPDSALHPVRDASIEHDASQCGYCTPGQVCSAVALLAEGRAHTEEEIRESMSGNPCRRGAYPHIVRAVQHVLAGAR